MRIHAHAWNARAIQDLARTLTQASTTFSFGLPRIPGRMGGWNRAAMWSRLCGMPRSLPSSGHVPRPSLDHCAAPAGKGLTMAPEGFPKNAIRTAGGYTIVPTGSQNSWHVYAPGQKWGETPMTNVWGDPHVNESDGTRWDFTKNSDFRLPDGTLIKVDTTAQTGASVTKGLTIVNGADRVSVSGIDANQPKVSAISHDGYAWRAEHVDANPGRDTYVLGGSKQDVRWYKETNGHIQGLVTGSKTVNGSYEAILDRKTGYSVSDELKTDPFTPAWGNAFRSYVADLLGRLPLSQGVQDLAAAYLNVDHQQGAWASSGWGGFGGLGHTFPTWGGVSSALADFRAEWSFQRAQQSEMRHLSVAWRA